jgi:3-oxoacyl-[acyl-carrier protein] reductase
MMKFKDQAILITGASRGIGRAIAMAFARQGAKIGVNFYRNQAAAEATLRELPGEGHLLLQADVGDPEQIRQMVNSFFVKYGKIDVLVNNAGIFEAHPVDEMSYPEWQESWKRTMDINLTGPANLCYCAAQYMIRQGGGRMINVSSRGAFRGEPAQPAYGAAKAGLNAMSQSLAQALAPYAIFVGVVAPGFVATEMTEELLNGPNGEAIRRQSPLGRVARPEEVAEAVLALAAPEMLFSTGAILDVNGASYLR